MKSRTIALIIGLLAIAVGVTGIIATRTKKPDTMPAASTGTVMAPAHDASMLTLLKAQTGDAYDQMFITMMTEHHAGAIVMANLVVNDAKHPELKTLAQNIITAQTKEISDMKNWAAAWSYSYAEPSQKAVDTMAAGLKGKTGDALDKQFLSDMIAHHQSALDMANLTAGRAKHDEIKTLSTNILTSQTTEIAQMKSYQSSWGYPSKESSNHSMSSMHQ